MPRARPGLPVAARERGRHRAPGRSSPEWWAPVAASPETSSAPTDSRSGGGRWEQSAVFAVSAERWGAGGGEEPWTRVCPQMVGYVLTWRLPAASGGQTHRVRLWWEEGLVLGNGEKGLGQEHVPLLPSGLSALLKPDPGVSVEVPPETGSHPPKQSHENVT